MSWKILISHRRRSIDCVLYIDATGNKYETWYNFVKKIHVLNEIAVLQAFEYFTGIVFNWSHIAYRRKSPYSLITVLLIMTLINTCGYRGIETSASVMLATSKIARLIVIVSLFLSELSLHKQLRYGVEYTMAKTVP